MEKKKINKKRPGLAHLKKQNVITVSVNVSGQIIVCELQSTHTRTHAHTHTRTHVHTYTRTHVHTYTRTHAHTYNKTAPILGSHFNKKNGQSNLRPQIRRAMVTFPPRSDFHAHEQ